MRTAIVAAVAIFILTVGQASFGARPLWPVTADETTGTDRPVDTGRPNIDGPQEREKTRRHWRCWRVRRAERGFARKINRARASKGRGGLKLDRQLSKVARYHTREMVQRGTLYHTTSQQLTHRTTRWLVLGENVGVGQAVGSLHRAFMDSPPHRENVMLPRFNFVGVGTRRAGGRVWVTVVFETIKNPGTRLKVPSC